MDFCLGYAAGLVSTVASLLFVFWWFGDPKTPTNGSAMYEDLVEEHKKINEAAAKATKKRRTMWGDVKEDA